MQAHLKRLIIIVIILLNAGILFAQKEIFLRQIEFKLEKISDIDYENEYFMTMKFNKGESYLFKITNHLDNYAGQAVIEILDADKLVMTNNLGEKYFETINFVCNKTGFYDILVRFKDKKVGNCVIDVKLLQ
ncbi:MAG: hypothetical protein JXB00_04860 [Bacteroidales bacterium]|nr:hypothetical protein [Bacteroidales bacterium]